MSLKNKLKKQKVIIVAYVFVTGPGHALEKYLSGKVNRLFFIGHPFVFAKEKRSHYHLYDNEGKLIKETFSPYFSQHQLINIVKDTFLTLFWVLKQGRFDIFFGVGGIDACLGIFLKKIGWVKKVIFYTIDFVPKRFENQLLNKIYHFLDRMAISQSDFVWNLSSIMIKEREKRGLPKKFRNKQLTVPVGADLMVKPRPFSKINRFEIAYLGSVTKKQGVQLAISALPEIITEVSETRLIIIGGGAYLSELKQLAKKLGVSEEIEFTGFVDDHREIEKRLSLSAIAVAPYVDSEDNFVRYTDPGKVKAYLAAGLPVVITKVPKIAFELERKKCGFAVKDDSREIGKAIIRLLTNGNLLKIYRQNAYNFAKKYAWERIFDQAFRQIGF